MTLQEMKWKQVPWVNKDIQNLIKIRDTIHRKYLRQKSTFWFKAPGGGKAIFRILLSFFSML